MGNRGTSHAQTTRRDSDLQVILQTSHEVLVKFGEHKRIVTVVNGSYQSLLTGFQETFSDVVHTVPPSAIEFRHCQHDSQNGGEIITEEESIEYRVVYASVQDTDESGSTDNKEGVFPLDGKKYNIWSFTSGGYLYTDGTNLTASGKADTSDAAGCEWITREVPSSPQLIAWSFLNYNTGKEIVADTRGLGVATDGSITDGSNLFVPHRVPGTTYLYTYTALQMKTKVNEFLAANGDGTMTRINKPPITNIYRPQALFAAFQLD